MRIFCIEKAISFLHSKEHLEMSCKWILKAEEKDSLALTQPQKYAILKMYCAATHFSKEEKDALKAHVLKDDNSDEG